MKRFILAAVAVAAVLGLSATAASAQDIGPLWPAPGKAVEVSGFKCLITSPHDRWAWCSGVGKTALPPCVFPAVVENKLVCNDRHVSRRN
jgi:hypothetical protein